MLGAECKEFTKPAELAEDNSATETLRHRDSLCLCVSVAYFLCALRLLGVQDSTLLCGGDRRDLLLDALHEAVRCEPVRHDDGIADRQRVRASMTDEGDARCAEEGRTAVRGIVHAPPEAPERPSRQQRSDTQRDRARQLVEVEVSRGGKRAIDDYSSSTARACRPR